MARKPLSDPFLFQARVAQEGFNKSDLNCLGQLSCDSYRRPGWCFLQRKTQLLSVELLIISLRYSLAFFLLVLHFLCYDCHETKTNNKLKLTKLTSRRMQSLHHALSIFRTNISVSSETESLSVFNYQSTK